jgi:hypothetical protein
MFSEAFQLTGDLNIKGESILGGWVKALGGEVYGRS